MIEEINNKISEINTKYDLLNRIKENMSKDLNEKLVVIESL